MKTVIDRTAVLVVGLVAGFAVGISFSSTPLAVLAPTAAPSAAPASAIPAADAPTPAPDAPQRIDPRVTARVAKTGIVQVGVFGDSFGVGVWSALYRMLPEREGYRVLRFGREATGFTRYRVADLTAQAKDDVRGDPIDVAVISLGVNDAQDMWDGRLYPFMSDGWKRVVGQRIDSFVAATRSTGAAVYWVGLPVMRDPVLDAKVQALNGFFATRMRALGVPFLPTRARSVDTQGRYASHLPDPKTGAPMLVRTTDGVHMIGMGYQRLLPDVAARIRDYARRAFEAAHRAPSPSQSGRTAA